MSTPTILILDLPPKTFVGVDLVSFNSSPNFHGIYNLSPGYHFLYAGTDASLSIRHGRWFVIQAQSSNPQIYVFRWDVEHENLSLIDSSDSLAVAAIASIPSLQGRGLVDFIALQDASLDLQSKSSTNTSVARITAEVEDARTAWQDLTSYITAQTLTRIMSGDSLTRYIDTRSPAWTISSISTSPQDNEPIPGLDAEESHPVLRESGASALQFVSINLKHTWPQDSVGRDRTDKARDKSWYLTSIIDGLSSTISQASSSTTIPDADRRQRGAREFLAELQYCFVMVLTLANYSALEQWKRILSVVFGCKSALQEVEPYFIQVVKVLRVQLARVEDVEGGLFEMSDEIGSQWLRHALKDFRGNVNEILQDQEENQTGLRGALGDLEIWLRKTYGWADEKNMLRRGMLELEDGETIEVQMDDVDEEEETGEYAPVIVET